MTEKQIALARRAVACKGWRDMPGMRQLASSNLAPYRIVCDGYAPPEDEFFVMAECGDPEILPDLTDPATLGCLLALVRKAWGDPTICTSALQLGDVPGWVVECFTQPSNIHVLAPCSTEVEIVVTALEAAP